MKRALAGILFLSIMASGIFSCKKDGKVPDMGYNYFPDKPGRYVVYDVDSFFYDDFTGNIDTAKFQLKEKVESIFMDNQNRPAMRLERYVKYYNDSIPYSLMNWTLRHVWMANKTSTTAEKVEENERYIKLAFPVKETQRWDGNAQNSLGEEEYQYYFYDQARIIGPMLFDSVLQVTQDDYTDFINKRYYIEKYARNVGLVYKQVIDIESQPPFYPPPFESESLYVFYQQPIMTRVSSGVFYTLTFNSAGAE